MIREMTLMFTLGLGVAACGSDDDGDSSNTPTSSAGGTAGSGGTAGGGAGGTAGGGMTSNGSGGSSTTGISNEVCERGCEATLEADCAQGPADMEECMADCARLSSGGCSAEYAAFQTCAEGEAISCPEGFPTVAACASEQSDFIGCITQ